ncbi:hypothetical protein V6X62_01590 [Spiribacter sp. 218]|uniref:hypothetical protein n=1 Tax=Spiribacter pallidus TaxID=1987936 RepID=UPI00349F8E20
MTDTTTNKTDTNVAADALADFQKRVNTIAEDRAVWQQTLFTDSNEELYRLLSEIYELYEHTRNNDALAEKSLDWLYAECSKKQIKLTKKPTHLQLLVKYVFADGSVDSRRISSYVRVLTAAALSYDVTNASHVPEFIRSRGGVEEVRAALAKNTLPPRVRAERGRELAEQYPTVATVDVESVKHNLSAVQNDYVVLLGRVNTQGSVEVKHVCFNSIDSKKVLTCATAIKAALSNIYSNHQKQQKAIQSQLDGERESKSATADIANTPAANDSDMHIDVDLEGSK